MPTVELDEATIANLPEMQRVWMVASKIAADPKAREMMQEAVLLADPTSAGPEARMRHEARERESAIEKRLGDFLTAQEQEKKDREAEEAKRRLETEWLAGRSNARRAGYDGESLTNLEKFMEDRGIADHEIAISHFEKLNPPPPPVKSSGTRWNFFEVPADRPDIKRLFDQDYDGFLDQAVPSVLNDVRSGNGTGTGG